MGDGGRLDIVSKHGVYKGPQNHKVYYLVSG